MPIIHVKGRSRSSARPVGRLMAGIVLGVLLVFAVSAGVHHTSTDRVCVACHVHPRADSTWTLSTHYRNASGVVVHCEECHLPPSGAYRLSEKARMGLRDVFSTLFKDTKKIDWQERAALYNAQHYTYDSSCRRCHADLYSLNLSQKGKEAHEHYEEVKGQINCINCHKSVGHFREETAVASDSAPPRPERPAGPEQGGEGFRNYRETIPGTDVTFEMLAVPGGKFSMGSPGTEAGRDPDEGPCHEVNLSPFWIGETEVTWNEFQVYFDETAQPARKDTLSGYLADTSGVDAMTGPTPRYGSKDIGGWEAACTMTYHAATKYCAWLSKKTGRKYRLPTEAEWEYCARAGTEGPYFFEADPAKLTSRSLRNRLFGTEDGTINRYVYYARNSGGQVHNPYTNEPNPWGLYDMLGNVREFCRDYYSPDAYYLDSEGKASGLPSGPALDPGGPPSGVEHVVRGGSFLSDPAECRAASRASTHDDAWRITDPHKPKSIWWYSDCVDVGFRVVREPEAVEADSTEAGTN